MGTKNEATGLIMQAGAASHGVWEHYWNEDELYEELIAQ